MTIEVFLDATDIEQLSKAILRLPGEIKTKAMARAMVRMRDMARTQIVKRSAAHVKLPQKVVRDFTTAVFNAGGNTQEVIVRSGWVHLYKLGAKQTHRGVYVRTRGSYRHAFIATMKSGHSGVFLRHPGTKMVGKNKEKLRELFGPNPAHAITNNPEVYLDVLAEIIRDHLAPRMLHEIGRLLPD